MLKSLLGYLVGIGIVLYVMVVIVGPAIEQFLAGLPGF